MTDADVTADADEQPTAATAPFVFLLGVILFGASLVAFVADLVTGHDVLRSLGANAVAVAVLVCWAAVDTLSDPDSEVATRRGAAGTGLLLFGLYLVVAGVVVAVTSLVHGRLELALWGGGLGVAVVLVGFVVYPRGTVLDRDSEAGVDPTSGDGTTDDAAVDEPET
jgi:peptidoglycan/LPS O-acetylase OafA/YrhL